MDHTVEDNFQHFAAYSGVGEEHPYYEDIRRAYYHGANADYPGDSSE